MAENKQSLRDIATLLARRSNIAETQAEGFVKAFIETVLDGLKRDMIVKVKGLGTFKLVSVESRESINVNTGERFMIEGHSKVSFTPDPVLRDEINKPFADFQTVVLADTMDVDAIGKLEEPAENVQVEEVEPETPVAESEEKVLEPVVEDEELPESVREETVADKKTTSPWRGVAATIAVIALMAVSYVAGYYSWPELLLSERSAMNVDKQEQVPSAPSVETTDERPEPDPAKPKAEPKPKAPEYPQVEGARYRIVGVKGTHTLKLGQSLREVAIKYYGHKDFTPYIIVLNDIANPDVVPLGKELKLPKLEDTVPADSTAEQ